ncbi:MAG TPA: hypothetical protein VMZ90_12740 [Vicinamibacterales bacterium]|nr:hypothetical protein [Vicinamibacterales bacterium]
MDDTTHNDLLAKLADAEKREAHALQQMQEHGAQIEQVRKEFGNPYFYSGRGADDPESKSHFTGYKSNEQAFRLWQQWRDSSRETEAIRGQLPVAGSDSGR